MFSKKLTNLKNLSISTKLILYIYISVLVLLFFLLIILLWVAESFSEDELDKNNILKLDYGRLLIEQEQSYMFGLSDYYSMSTVVQDIINKSNDDINNIDNFNNILDYIDSGMYLVSIVFYNKSGNVIDYKTIDNSRLPVAQSPYDMDKPFGRLINKQYGYEYEWEFIDEGSTHFMLKDNSPKLSLWRVIKDKYTLSPIGVICLSIDTRKLLTTDLYFSTLYNEVILLDSDKETVLDKTETNFSQNAKNILIQNAHKNDKDKFIAELDGKKYRIYFKKIPHTDIVGFLPVPYKNITWDMQIISVYAISGIILFTLILLPFLVVITKNVTQPLKKLTYYMKRFANGDRSIHINFKYNDEIGTLCQVFNTMVNENNKLIEKTYMLKLQEQEAELNALHEQINPHFLYNILNSIQWKASQCDNEEIADIAFNLAQFFRISLNSGQHMYELNKEKDLIIYYLKLQKGRYGNRLEYELCFDKDILNFRIPKLIIQPLVENAVVHGIEKSTENIHIDINVYHDKNDNMLTISVKNDGISIKPDILALLPDKMPMPIGNKKNHLALKNIYNRLKILYGTDFVFLIDNIDTGGVEVLIKIPFENK